MAQGVETWRRKAKEVIRAGIKNVRMSVTDVTEIELLAEEVTNGDEWGPVTSTMATLAAATMYTDDSFRILAIIRKRLQLSRCGGYYWRQIYKTLVLVEYLLGNGPCHIASLINRELPVFEDLCEYTSFDDAGFDRGHNVRVKAQRVCELLLDSSALNSKREAAQKLSREIRGFGAFSKNMIAATDFSDCGGSLHDKDDERSVSSQDDCEKPFTVTWGTKEQVPVMTTGVEAWDPFGLNAEKEEWRGSSNASSVADGESLPSSPGYTPRSVFQGPTHSWKGKDGRMGHSSQVSGAAFDLNDSWQISPATKAVNVGSSQEAQTPFVNLLDL